MDRFANASDAFKRLNAAKLAGLKSKRKRGAGKGRPTGPNKTEAEFNRLFLGGRGMYEAVTFRLPGGSRYTPDWVYFEEGFMHVVEVKGSYRLPSEGRAWTAFREARAAFPYVQFEWWTKLKDGAWKDKLSGDLVLEGGPSDWLFEKGRGGR